MKRGILLLLIILLSTTINAQEFNNYDEIYLNLNTSSSIDVIPTDTNYDIKAIKVSLFLYPEDNWQQNVLNLQTTPSSEQTSDSIIFEWNNIKAQELNFLTSTDVKVKNKVFPIRNKISFPITVPDKLKQYTKATEKINSDDNRIIKLASSLAEGEDDLFKVMFNIANFTKNYINYDLKFAGEVKSSLWILNNRNGVCGDFSSLFMALTRALNIPIKYVTGVAYSDFEDKNEFVPHAWTEVYFPDIGWIPFDPTYGEYGYIDPSHIKLKEFAGVDNPSVHYEWSGKNYNVNIKKLQFDGKITKKQGTYSKPFTIETDTERNIVDIGSYQLIQAKIKNLKDYYIAGQLYLVSPVELNLISKQNQAFFLEPNQEKEIFWLVQVDETLSQGYTYTFPYTIRTIRNINAEDSFNALPGAESYTLSELQKKVQQRVEEKEKVYSTNVELLCESPDTEIYTYEPASVNCQISNTGNKYLENLYICIKENCELLDLGIGQQKELAFNVLLNQSTSVVEVTAQNHLITKTESVQLTILESPKIIINNLNYPNEVSFNDQYTLELKLSKETLSEVKDIVLDFNYKQYPINDFQFQKEIQIKNLKASNLIEGENQLPITIEYKDKKDKQYTTTQNIKIKLNQLNFWQKIITKLNYFFNQLSHGIF